MFLADVSDLAIRALFMTMWAYLASDLTFPKRWKQQVTLPAVGRPARAQSPSWTPPAGAPPDAGQTYWTTGFFRKLLRSADLTRTQFSRPSRTMRIGTSAPAGPASHSRR